MKVFHQNMCVLDDLENDDDDDDDDDDNDNTFDAGLRHSTPHF